MRVLVTFDRVNLVISLTSEEDIGRDTGIVVGYQNILNQLDRSAVDESGMITKYYPTGANGLGIEYVNFGQDYILDLDYYMNAKDQYGKLKYVGLATYKDGKTITERWQDYIAVIEANRDAYIEQTKQYNSAYLEWRKLYDRLPIDGCSIDYTKYSYEELAKVWVGYQNALAALLVLFKEDYPEYFPEGQDPIFIEDDESTWESTIKNTMYWWDFYAYKKQILPSIKEAFKIWCKTNETTGELIYDLSYGYLEPYFEDLNGDGKYEITNLYSPIEDCEIGTVPNPLYKEGIITNIDYFLYEFSMYGIDELKAKIIAWENAANHIIVGHEDIYKEYVNVHDTPHELWPIVKSNFEDDVGEDAFAKNLNLYRDYYCEYERENSLTKTTCKGVIYEARQALAERQAEADAQQGIIDNINESRKAIQSMCTFNNFFTDEEKEVLNLFIKEADYSNSNILTTNLDDIVTAITAQNELYVDACKALEKKSQPQWHFNITTENLFSLVNYKPVLSSFEVGNFIRVQSNLYENKFIKLRLLSYSYNPCEDTESLNLEFSNMTYAYNKLSDLDYIFENMSGGSSGGGTSAGSSSSSGNYGVGNSDVTLSNTMLSALLRTASFATSIKDALLNTVNDSQDVFAQVFTNNMISQLVETEYLKAKFLSINEDLKDAAKTATNFIKMDPNGIYVGEVLDGVITGACTVIKGNNIMLKSSVESDTYAVLNSSGLSVLVEDTAIASFGESVVINSRDNPENKIFINADGILLGNNVVDSKEKKYVNITETGISFKKVMNGQDMPMASFLSDGIHFYEGNDEIASFKGSANVIGKLADKHVTLNSSAITFYDNANQLLSVSDSVNVYSGGQLATSISSNGMEVYASGKRVTAITATGMNTYVDDKITTSITSTGMDIYANGNLSMSIKADSATMKNGTGFGVIEMVPPYSSGDNIQPTLQSCPVIKVGPHWTLLDPKDDATSRLCFLYKGTAVGYLTSDGSFIGTSSGGDSGGGGSVLPSSGGGSGLGGGSDIDIPGFEYDG
jgi:hypothetical protein